MAFRAPASHAAASCTPLRECCLASSIRTESFLADLVMQAAAGSCVHVKAVHCCCRYHYAQVNGSMDIPFVIMRYVPFIMLAYIIRSWVPTRLHNTKPTRSVLLLLLLLLLPVIHDTIWSIIARDFRKSGGCNSAAVDTMISAGASVTILIDPCTRTIPGIGRNQQPLTFPRASTRPMPSPGRAILAWFSACFKADARQSKAASYQWG